MPGQCCWLGGPAGVKPGDGHGWVRPRLCAAAHVAHVALKPCHDSALTHLLLGASRPQGCRRGAGPLRPLLCAVHDQRGVLCLLAAPHPAHGHRLQVRRATIQPLFTGVWGLHCMPGDRPWLAPHDVAQATSTTSQSLPGLPLSLCLHSLAQAQPCCCLPPAPAPARSWLHVIHHKYNKGDQMSPFAGLAFHPLDGIMQVGGLMPVAVGVPGAVASPACTRCAAGARMRRPPCMHPLRIIGA